MDTVPTTAPIITTSTFRDLTATARIQRQPPLLATAPTNALDMVPRSAEVPEPIITGRIYYMWPPL